VGYYTRFKLTFTPESEDVIRRIEEDEVLSLAIDEYADRYKWYEHEKDMIALSKEFPDVLFELYGEGEAPGDLWRKYFKGGKIQRCYAKITFDPFDEKKLEEETH
jgi:hypothetical protein